VVGPLFASYVIDCQFNVNSVASASRVTLLAKKKCKIIVTRTLDKIARQTKTPVAVTVVVGSLDSMYVYAFIQYINGHSYRFHDWIHDISVDVKGKGRTDGHRLLNANAAAAAAVIAKRDAELRAFYVVVPPGDEARPVSCPICKVIIKSELLEDD
jgi:hypothetical protein